MKVTKAHCFFEQSGTFKNEFKKLGIEAEDYDILNDFGETDNNDKLLTGVLTRAKWKPGRYECANYSFRKTHVKNIEVII